jgi:uncharacterized protein
VIDGAVVIDGVGHSYDFSPANSRQGWDPVGTPGDGWIARMMSEGAYDGFTVPFSPANQPQWLPPRERFYGPPDPDLLASAMFGESETDILVYHEVPLFGLWKNGLSVLETGLEMRKRYPGRVLIYGAVSPFMDDPLGTIDRLVDEVGIVGLKLYPMDLYQGKMQGYRMDDPEVAYPIFERARDRGITSIAVHKAMPLGPVKSGPFKVTDVEGPAFDFPDLSFEIVHGGFAFLEETISILGRFSNVSLNLECTTAYLANQPRRFAEIIGAALYAGGEDRLIWATGCINVHPKPYLDAFWNFKMPEDLLTDYGFPEVTDEVKRKILGGNLARILGLNLTEMAEQYADDEFSRQTELRSPWSGGMAL